jgi:uncharacterized membrane protein
MSAAQLHLALTHFPIAGEFFVVLFLLLALIFKKREFLFSGMIIAIFSAIFIIPLDLSGEGAEEIVEHKVGVSKSLIHDHEEAAEKSVVIVVTTGVIASAWFFALRIRKNWTNKIEKIVFVFSFISLFFIGYTAHLGGMIRHDELRSGSIQLNEVNGDDD